MNLYTKKNNNNNIINYHSMECQKEKEKNEQMKDFLMRKFTQNGNYFGNENELL